MDLDKLLQGARISINLKEFVNYKWFYIKIKDIVSPPKISIVPSIAQPPDEEELDTGNKKGIDGPYTEDD